MTWNLTSPVTGSAQTGLTSPTYTLAADVAPNTNGKQSVVTALGGTQTGVLVHTIQSPFSLNFVRPSVLRTLGNPGNNGVIANVPRNVWRLITRKGVTPAANQPAQTMLVTTTIEVPAGADTYDGVNIRAALSAHIGALTQQSAGIGDSAVSGVF